MIERDAADQIAPITLKRSERLNALTFAMRGESPEAAPGRPTPAC
jgi:enoyl-CoA hydratase/carnithine racemase